jgi:Flp pilus assembly protein TadD
LLFAVHPVHTEVLGEVVGRAELLAAAGSLASLLAFLRGRAAERDGGAARAWYALSIAGFAAGFLAKENAIAAPLLVLAADRLFAGRPLRWSCHCAMALALGACLWARTAALGGPFPHGGAHFIDNPIAHLPFLQGRLTALDVIGRYAGLLVAPLRLSIDYSYNAIPAAGGWLEPRVLFGAAVVAGWAAGLILAWRRRPAAAFGLLFVGVALGPTANLLFPIGTIMAERLLYLPSVGLCLLAGDLAARVRRPEGAARRRALVWGAACAVLLALLAARGVARLRDWRDDRTIFRRATEVVPGSVRAQYNYGTASEEAGDDAAAQAAYERALGVWPHFGDAHYNLAGIHARRSRWDDAVLHYRLAVSEAPADVRYLVNLGRALNAAGSPREAAEVLERAAGLDPSSDLAFTNLGAARLAEGDAAGAAAAYRAALRLAPDNPDYLKNLALALDALGDVDGAITALRNAVAARPGDPIAHHHLGRVLEGAGREAEAIAAYGEAIRLAPDSPVPLRNLGMLLLRTGDAAGARRALERCAALDPGGHVLGEAGRGTLERLRRESPRP